MRKWAAVKFINGEYQAQFEYLEFEIVRPGSPDSTYVFFLPNDGHQIDRRVAFPIANIRQMNSWTTE